MSVQLYMAKRAFVPPPSLPAQVERVPDGVRPLGFLTVIAEHGDDRLAVGHDTALGVTGVVYAVALDKLGAGRCSIFEAHPICALAARNPKIRQLLDKLEDQGLAVFLIKQCPLDPTPLPASSASPSTRLHLQFEDFPGQVLLRGVPAIDDRGELHAWLLSVDRRLRPRYLAAPLAELRSLIEVLNAVVALGSLPRWSLFRRQLGKAGGLLLRAMTPFLIAGILLHFYLRQPLRRLVGYQGGLCAHIGSFGSGGGCEPLRSLGPGSAWLCRVEPGGYAGLHLVNPLGDVNVQGARALIIHYAGGPAREGVWEVKLKDRKHESQPWLLPGTGSPTTWHIVEVDLADPRFRQLDLHHLYGLTLATTHRRITSDPQQAVVPLVVQRLEFR